MRGPLRAFVRVAAIVLTFWGLCGQVYGQALDDSGAPVGSGAPIGSDALTGEDTAPVEDSEPVPRRPEEASGTTDLDRRHAVDAQLIDKPIGRVEFDCDLTLCDSPANVREFIALSGLSVGQSFSSERMLRAETRLSKTGFFQSLQVTKRLVEGSVFIAIQAKGAVLIRNVGFGSLDTPPFRSDLQKVLIYRQGQPFRNAKKKRDSQIESLRLLFEREGYFGTQIEVVPTGVEGRTHQVDIEIRIAKGQPRRVCDVGMRGVSAMPYVEAREYLVGQGALFSSRLRIFDENYTERGFREGQQALIQEYRRRGYFQARVVDKAVKFEDEGCVTLIVDVVEGPRWELEFSGISRFTREELIEELPFFESGYVDSEEVRRAKRAIERVYATRGHAFAKVEAREVRKDRLERKVEFEVEEGPQLEIRSIDFEGIEAISSDVLRDVMTTRVFALFDVGGYLQQEALLSDFSKIENLYRERGYNRAFVRGFSLRVEDDKLDVTIEVQEGEPTTIQRVDVDGNRKLPDGTLIESVTSRASTPFVPLAVKGDQTKLSRRYSELGHPLTTVSTRCFLMSGDEVPCEAPRLPRGCAARTVDDLEGRCEWEDEAETVYACKRLDESPSCALEGGVQADKVRILHVLSEGPFVRVGPRFLKGTFQTRSSVVYREIPFESGDPLDTQKIVEAQGNLRQLNIFESINIQTIGLDKGITDEEAAEAALLINVEESDTEFLDFKFGFELREPFVEDRQLLLTGEAQYTNRNVFGYAQGLQPRIIGAFDTLRIVRDGLEAATPGAPGRIDTLDFLFGAEILYTHPRFLKDLTGIDKLYLTVAPFYLLDLLGVANRNLLREEWGVRTEVRKDLSELLDRLFFKLGVEFKQIATFASDGTIIGGTTRVFSPRRTQGKIEPDLALDRRDSPLNPTRGYFLRAQPALVSGDALGKGGENFFEDSFLRLTLTGSFFVPMWRGEVVLAQGLRVGQAIPLLGRELPIPNDERFFLGGARSVRGFTDGSLGPVNENQVATGGEFFINYNAELRYPLLPQWSIYGAMFFDAGLLSDCFVEETDGNPRRSCYEDAFGSGLRDVRLSSGVGLRILIFDQIPILFDYGIVLNRRPGEAFGQVHLNVGYTFD